MSSATGRKPTDAGSLLPGRRRLPPGDAANAVNPVNAQHLPDCSAADFSAPQALPTPFLPTLPRQATTDVLPATTYRLSLLEHKKIATRFRMTTFHPLFFFNSHPKHDPHTHPNHYFFFSILFRISSRYFSKIPAYSLPAVEYFQE